MKLFLLNYDWLIELEKKKKSVVTLLLTPLLDEAPWKTRAMNLVTQINAKATTIEKTGMLLIYYYLMICYVLKKWRDLKPISINLKKLIDVGKKKSIIINWNKKKKLKNCKKNKPHVEQESSLTSPPCSYSAPHSKPQRRQGKREPWRLPLSWTQQAKILLHPLSSQQSQLCHHEQQFSLMSQHGVVLIVVVVVAVVFEALG